MTRHGPETPTQYIVVKARPACQVKVPHDPTRLTIPIRRLIINARSADCKENLTQPMACQRIDDSRHPARFAHSRFRMVHPRPTGPVLGSVIRFQLSDPLTALGAVNS